MAIGSFEKTQARFACLPKHLHPSGVVELVS